VISLPVSTSLTNRAYQIGGVLVGIALGAVTALWEAVLTPLYVIIGGTVVRLPVAALLAIITNAGLVWFTRKVTGRTGLALLPGVAWLIVIGGAGTQTSDGDLIITGNNWVGIVTILLGSLAWAGAGYFAITRSGSNRATGASIFGLGPAGTKTVPGAGKSGAGKPAGPAKSAGAGKSVATRPGAAQKGSGERSSTPAQGAAAKAGLAKRPESGGNSAAGAKPTQGGSKRGK
jgi:hypothetical protein